MEKIVFRNVRPSSTQIIECWPIRKHFDLDHFLGFILIIVLDLTRTARLPSRLVLVMFLFPEIYPFSVIIDHIHLITESVPDYTSSSCFNLHLFSVSFRLIFWYATPALCVFIAMFFRWTWAKDGVYARIVVRMKKLPV